MRIFSGLYLLAFTSYLLASSILPYRYPDLKHYDLVQVDTGVTRTLYGRLRITATATKGRVMSHGQNMAEIVSLELGKLGARPVSGAQVPFTPENTREDNLGSYMQGLRKVAIFPPRVLGLSVSGNQPSREEEAILRDLSDRDTLIVVASGNIRSSQPPFYPGSYPIACLVSVSQLRHGVRPPTYAPGQMYVAENPNYVRGTSSGAAIAEAIALDLRQRFPTESCARIKARMLRTSLRPACDGVTCPSPSK